MASLDGHRAALAPPGQLRAAILTVIGCGVALTVLQRWLLFAMAPYPVNTSGMLTIDTHLWLIWLILSPAVVMAARRWPFRERPARDFLLQLGAALALSALHTATFGPFQRLVGGPQRPFVEVAVVILSWRLAVDAFIYGTILMVTLALDAAARAKAEALAATIAGAESTRARLQALQMQIQPHFLFNALNTVAMLARSGQSAAAADVVNELSDLLRELVTEAPEARIPLREELAFVERYVAIERARFGERLRVTFASAPGALDVPVPRLLLQPIVENAVRHGLSRSPTSGAIAISATAAGGWLTLCVTDDGPGPAREGGGSSEGVGLGNTRSRLAALYGDDFELALSGSAAGAVATVRLPIAGWCA